MYRISLCWSWSFLGSYFRHSSGGNLSLNQLWLKLSLYTGLKITAGQWPDKMTIRNIFDRTFLNFRRSCLTGQVLILAGHCPLNGRYFEPWYIALRRVNLTSKENGSTYLRVIIKNYSYLYILYFIFYILHFYMLYGS